MCGITAIFHGKTPIKRNLAIHCARQNQDRGPDDTKIVATSTETLIFDRLAIMGDEKGQQPMSFEGATSMCNGEIYNYRKLAEEYDISLKTGSDCEIILPLYKKIGFEKMVHSLDGVFAIVVIDSDKVYVARDRIGVRPLFVGITHDELTGNMLAISSTLKVLAGFCDNRYIFEFPPGRMAVHTRVVDMKDGPTGIIENTFLKFTDRLSFARTVTDCTEEKMCEDLYTKLHRSIHKRIMSDRPIGCLLSGGLDSSIVAAVLARGMGAKNINTYSIGMEGSTDLHYARKVAEHIGTMHIEVIFTPREGFDIIPELIKVLGTYDITTIRASVGMYLLAKYIKANSNDTVIFSGEGSDEVFCGYLYFHNAPSQIEADNESIRLIENLHKFDVLRADRTISSAGLELRVPFLDTEVVDYALSLGGVRCPRNGYEKYILRKAFDVENYLPKEVLWRRKEGFSDGVSSTKKSWYEMIQEFVDEIISDSEYEDYKEKFPSKEAYYYYTVFKRHYPHTELKVDYWMPKWSNAKDPSGRMISAYDETCE